MGRWADYIMFVKRWNCVINSSKSSLYVQRKFGIDVIHTLYLQITPLLCFLVQKMGIRMENNLHAVLTYCKLGCTFTWQ